MLDDTHRVRHDKNVPGSSVLLSKESVGLGVSGRNGAFRNSISTVVDAVVDGDQFGF